MSDERPDEALMLAWRDGEAGAFDALYARHRGRLYRYLAHQCGPAHADELFQDVWMKVIAARMHYEVSARFTTWLFRIAHNRLIDHYRSRARSRLAEFDDAQALAATLEALPDPPAQQPATLLERKQLAQRLAVALEALPAPQREAFLLAEEGELTLDQIAAATGVGRETAKSRLRYALARLRAALAQERAT